MTTIEYIYRGRVERVKRRRGRRLGSYEWREGYSENAPDGSASYPWMTRTECREDANKRGARAVFVR